jgi:hypothetical protein
MTKALLDLSDAPDDPIERLMWLSGVADQVAEEMDAEWAGAYFWARFTGRLEAALGLGYHSRKRVMAYTRHGNESVGRTVRWGDGLR